MNDSTEKENTFEREDAPLNLPALKTDIKSPMATMLDPSLYGQLKRVAATFAESQLVPQRFRGKPHDVFIALHMAHRLGCDPILVLQNLYTVHGEPGWKAQFIIAQANMSGVFKGRIQFLVENRDDPKNMRVTAYAVMKGTEERIETTVSMDMARAEGWTQNKKYQSMPEQMLCYRAATFLVRRHAPEVMLGIPVVEEIEDMAASGQIAETKPEGSASAADILKRTGQAPGGDSQGGAAAQKNDTAEGAPEWPMWNEQSKAWVDSAGEVYDENAHGWSAEYDRPAVKQDGTFKAKRGTGGKTKAPPKQESAESSGPDAKTVLKWIEEAQDADELAVCEDSLRDLTEGEQHVCREAIKAKRAS